MNARRLLLLLAAPLLFADWPGGTPPRGGSLDYPAHAAVGGIEIGAARVSAAQVHKTLGNSLSDYLVFEVAMYPPDGSQISVAPRDFMLHLSANSETVSPVDADVIVPGGTRPMSQTKTADSNVHVYNEETIGYSTGPYYRGVYTDSRVGVGVGDPGGPRTAPPVRNSKDDLRRAVAEKELPDAKTSKPIAGLLYFPKPKKSEKNASAELVYYGQMGQAKLTIK